MSEPGVALPGWTTARTLLRQREPDLYELEPGGALALELNEGGWLLEITPDGRLVCQVGMAMDDIMSLLSDGTPEDLGTDEVAKQAKYYLQPFASKVRHVFLGAGFEESTEMNEEYVAILFQRAVDFGKPDEVTQAIRWCREQLTKDVKGQT
jgi:hypothetical protein